MSRLKMGDPGLPPESVCAYIEDMLTELANLADISGEPNLGREIRQAAKACPQAEKKTTASPTIRANNAA